MFSALASEPAFLREYALIYQEVPETDFSWLSINELDYEFGTEPDRDHEPAEDSFFEVQRSYNADLLHMQQKIRSLINDHDPTFSQKVLEIIRLHDKDEIDIYKRAYLDRKLFSKLRNNIFYQPSRNTAIALVFALELDIDTAQDLLRRAGFALSHASISDLIIEYFLINHNYNINALNEMLYCFGQPLIFD